MAQSQRRNRLTNRRPSEIFGFRWRGMDYIATISRFPDGRLAEIFLGGSKLNTDSDAIARDTGIVASIAL
jgi:ribonucleoside-diphosphate reductase alpha chain